jgi:hypothetical protein
LTVREGPAPPLAVKVAKRLDDRLTSPLLLFEEHEQFHHVLGGALMELADDVGANVRGRRDGSKEAAPSGGRQLPDGRLPHRTSASTLVA